MKRIITDQRAEIEKKFEHEVIIRREKIGYAERFLEYPNILTILGVRRCGKSIFSLLLARELSEKFGYINFDDERLAGISAGDLTSNL